MRKNREGQMAIVAGATSGISRSIAAYFAGATIAVDGGRTAI
jgi:NADP-dependent 3-hydroxy acid dehydrogenase YdfG